MGADVCNCRYCNSDGDEETAEWQKFRVELRSKPGMWTQYSGHVEVFAPDIDSAFEQAVKKLARTSFPDRPSMSSWTFLGATVIY